MKNLPPYTIEILLFNAYHCNPRWKVDEQWDIFGCLCFISTKIQFFDFIFLLWLFAILRFRSHLSGLTFSFGVRLCFPIPIDKVAPTRNLAIPCPIGRWSCRPVTTVTLTFSARGRGERRKSVRDVNKKMSEVWSKVKPRKYKIKEIFVEVKRRQPNMPHCSSTFQQGFQW